MQETAEQYRQRMFVLVDGKDPVKLQSAAPVRLAKLLKGVSPARARKRPSPDKWSIAEIVVHMADTEVVFGYLIRRIMGEPGTRIDGFDQDAWLAALHYGGRRQSAQHKKILRRVSRVSRSERSAAQVADSRTMEDLWNA